MLVELSGEEVESFFNDISVNDSVCEVVDRVASGEAPGQITIKPACIREVKLWFFSTDLHFFHYFFILD